MKTTKVTLRKKAISKGQISLYLDYYPPVMHPSTGKKTRREFLRLYIYEKPKGELERHHNKQTIALAESMRAKRQLDLQNGQYGFRFEVHKEKNFLDYFNALAEKRASTINNYNAWLSAIKRFKDFAPNGITFGELDIFFAEDYRATLSEISKLATNTKAAYFSKFKYALKKAFKDGLIQDNIGERIDGIKEEETYREFLSLDEVRQLMETPTELPDVFRNAFFFSVLTGLRFSDVQNLKWGDIHHSNEMGHYIRYEQIKTLGKEHTPIAADAIAFAGERTEPQVSVFPDLEYSDKNNKLLKLWAEKAGIQKKVTFHVARHTFATLQLTFGTDIYTVSKLLGHKSIKNTQVYAKLTDEKKRAAADRIKLL